MLHHFAKFMAVTSLAAIITIPISQITAQTSQKFNVPSKPRVMSLGDSLCANNMATLRKMVTEKGISVDWVGTKKDGQNLTLITNVMVVGLRLKCLG